MTALPVGVIVKTWNTGEYTRACLDRVVRADALPEELAVVDLGEDSATRRYLEELTDRHGVRLHWLPIGRRLAPGDANRRALDALSTPLACLLDNDVLVPKNWLGPLTTLLASPGVGLVAPTRPDPFLRYPGRDDSTEAVLDAIKGPDLPPSEVVGRFTGGAPFEELGRAVQAANGLQPSVEVAFPSFLSSCCLGFDRQAIEDAGGVADPGFDGGYGSEDVDLSWRVAEAGYALVRTAEVFVLHVRHASLERNQVDYQGELKAANQVLYARWRKRLLAWARARLRSGDTVADLSRRFIVRELIRNTSFEADLTAIGRSEPDFREA